MTTAQFADFLSQFTLFLIIFFALVPLLTLLVSRLLLNKSRTRQCLRFLSVIIHLTIIPGVCSLLVIAYLLFFTGTNLYSQLDLVLYLPPVISMVITLVLIRKIYPYHEIPGFGRLSGLLLNTGISFMLILLIYKLRLFVGFFLSFQGLLILFTLVFVLLKLASYKIRKKS